ncbi:Sex-regulated protein janus-A [Trachymyrmex zeteki]|uniref:Sex-regulated protein janus-A n=1 Tax=Mycetomoellerius zeteki TaxID=64791 RepID=A0A151XAL6_9HYME|nr:Sex-regulated protein janus-A [Trachymyrmex zeteki]
MSLSSVESSENAGALLVRTVIVGQTILVNSRLRRNDQVNELGAFVVAKVRKLNSILQFFKLYNITLIHTLITFMAQLALQSCPIYPIETHCKLINSITELVVSLDISPPTSLSLSLSLSLSSLPFFSHTLYLYHINVIFTLRSDIFDQVDEQIKKHAGLRANCVGGGRIEHDPDEKTIKVYGYSQGFGKADHQVSVELLKKKYSTYNVTWSDEVILYLTMFSRAAKSVVKSVGSRRIHIDEQNFKIVLIGGAREISQTLSQLLRNSVKLNALALYNVAAVRPLPIYNFYDEQPFKPISSKMPIMRKKSCLEEGNRLNAVINSTRQTDNNNHQGNNGRNQTEKLVEALYRLPIAEETPTLNSPLIPIEELMPKAGNACSRMRLYARVLGETSSSNMKTWQRDYATILIRKRFSDLTYPSFQEYDLNFIPEAKIAKKHRSIKKTRKIEHLSCSALIAKENNHQLLPTSLLNHGENPARRLMKKFRNVSILPNIEARCKGAEKLTDWSILAVLLNNKLRLLHEIYGRIKFPLSSLNFINYKRENNREVVSFDRDSETMTNDTLNVVEQENWIRRTYFKIKSILPDLHAKIRFHSATASDSYCSENIFVVNQVIPFSDIISNNAILFASKDYEADKPRTGIRRKIQEFCMQRKRTLKKNREKNDICKKREKSCEKRETEKRTDCSGRIKWAGKRQNVVSCKRRKSSCDKKYSRDCRKPRERREEIQEDPCKPKKDDTSRTEKDPCRVQPRERKVEIQEDPCKKKKDDTSRTEEDPCSGPLSMKQEQTYYELHDASPCRTEKKKDIKKKEEPEKKKEIKKKEEIKKPDCLEIKKVDPCKKKPCPAVKKLPECSDDTKGKGS